MPGGVGRTGEPAMWWSANRRSRPTVQGPGTSIVSVGPLQISDPWVSFGLGEQFLERTTEGPGAWSGASVGRVGRAERHV